MRRHLKSLVRWAVLKSVTDSGAFRTAIIESLAKEGRLVLITPYGLDHNPPAGALVASFQIGAEESNRFGIATAQQARFKALAASEVQIGNPEIGSSILFKADGTIEITAPKDATLNVTGDLTVTVGGNLTSTVTGNLISTVTGNADLSISGAMTSTATGSAALSGSSVALGGSGGAAVARVGDLVNITSGSSAGMHPIVTGSPNVTAT